MRLNGKFWKNLVVPKRLITLKFSVKVRILHSNLGHPSKEAMCCMLKQAKAPEAVQRAAQGFSSAMCVGKEVERHQRCLQLFQQSLVRGKWSMLTRFGGHLPIKRVKTNRFNIEHCVGASLLDECTNFHVAYVDRVDSEKTPGASRLRNKTAI